MNNEPHGKSLIYLLIHTDIPVIVYVILYYLVSRYNNNVFFGQHVCVRASIKLLLFYSVPFCTSAAISYPFVLSISILHDMAEMNSYIYFLKTHMYMLQTINIYFFPFFLLCLYQIIIKYKKKI